MTLSLLAAQVALAAVFVTAASTKLADREGSRRAMTEFGVPGRFVGPLAVLLPLVELATAAALVPDLTVRWGASASLALLLAFSAAIAVNLSRGRAPDCHCFGRLHSAPVSWWTVARNLLLALVAAGLVWGPVPGWLLLAAVAAALGVTVLERLRGGREPARPGLPVGSEAPEFRLSALDGATVTLSALRERGRPVLLVFSDAHCGPCAALAPDVARWQREHDEIVTIAMIERGRERAEAPDEHGRTVVLLQEDDELASAYGALGTPSAVLVDAAGRIASELAPGAEAIRLLVGEPEVEEPAIGREYLAPLARREFLLRAAGAAVTVGTVLALPARALAGTRRPASAAACPPGRKACGKNCCGPGQKCIRKAFGKPKCICDDFVYRDVCPDGCQDTAIDNTNCGKCGVECLPGRWCVGGECQRVHADQCPGGCPGENDDPTRSWCCDGQCKDLYEDLDNCGACGKPCTGGKKPTCCEGYCRDIKSDPRHCGGCFKACPTQGICHAGKCRDACPKPLKQCGKTCYRPRTERCCNGKVVAKDDLCGDGCTVCPPGLICENGECVSDSGCLGCSDTPWGPFDLTCCDGECSTTLIDTGNCGGCGRACISPTPELGSCGCSAGECLTIGQFGMQPCVASRPLTRRERRRLRSARNLAG